MAVDTQLVKERLKELRAERDLSQTDLANESGIERKSIIRYESGQNVPGGRNLISLAEVLNVSTDYILGLVDTQQHPTESQLAQDEVDCVMAIRKHPRPEYRAQMVDMLTIITG